MRFTEKYKNLGILFAIVLLNTIDSAFFPNTTFSLYKLFANIFLVFLLVKFIGVTFSDFKSGDLANTLSLKSILGHVFILSLWLLMFININF